jgi:hypothetical protein
MGYREVLLPQSAFYVICQCSIPLFGRMTYSGSGWQMAMAYYRNVTAEDSQCQVT